MAKPKSKKGKRNSRPAPTHIYVLAESDSAGIQKFSDQKKISVEKLREHLQSFTEGISAALSSVQTLAGKFELHDVEVQAMLSAEAGFVWVTKVGVQGGVTLKFVRK